MRAMTAFGVEELIGRRSKEIPWTRPLQALAWLCSCVAVTLAAHTPGDGTINIILIALVSLPLVWGFRNFLTRWTSKPTTWLFRVLLC